LAKFGIHGKSNKDFAIIISANCSNKNKKGNETQVDFFESIIKHLIA
jgi:hypothetical protein